MCVLVCTQAFCATATGVSDVAKAITVTLGKSVQLNPAADVGFNLSSSPGLFGGVQNISYLCSAEIWENRSNYRDGFTKTESSTQTGYTYQLNGAKQQSRYTVYTLTAIKTGSYQLVVTVTYKGDGYTDNKAVYNNVRATYNINVVEVTSISIPTSQTMTVGSSYTFTPQIFQQGATTSLTWTSTNPSVAVVDNGTVYAAGVGSAVITCTAENGVSAQCVVTVNPILATSVSLNTYRAELSTGEQFQLLATVYPENATNRAVTWGSTNPDIASVDGNGLVTAKSPGECVIVAAAADGSNQAGSCTVTVLSDVLYADNAVGVPSGTLVLPIQLKNQSPITGCQFELQLPEGVSVTQNKAGSYIATMSDRSSDQDIMCSKLSNGNYQVIVFSPTSAALSGDEGAIAYVTLNVGETVAEGGYSLGIKSIELTKTTGEAVHHKDMTSTLTITSATVGDTNGDGSVTVTDAVGIVNYILGRAPSVFITKAADVNGDGSITITDAVNVINIILNK